MKQICRPGAKFDMGWLFQTILNIHGNRVRDLFCTALFARYIERGA
jgi:hypothetical protein